MPFAAHQDRFVRPVDVLEIEAGEFGVADAAAIEQFENGLVARRPAGCIVAHRVHHPIHLLDRGHARQMLGQPRRGYQRGRILLDAAGARQPLEPTANGGQRARRGSLRKAALVERAQVGADIGVLDPLHAHDGVSPSGIRAARRSRPRMRAARVRRRAACGRTRHARWPARGGTRPRAHRADLRGRPSHAGLSGDRRRRCGSSCRFLAAFPSCTGADRAGFCAPHDGRPARERARGDDAGDARLSAGPAPGGYRPGWWKYRRGPESAARCAGRRRAPPCGWRNCGAAYAGWRSGSTF